eukprot:c21973_g1_i1 orf=680-2749(+)
MAEFSSKAGDSSGSLDNAGLSELLTARNRLHTAMQKCRSLEDDLCKTGPRLQRIAKRIPSLEVAFEPLRSHRRVLDDLVGNIDQAVAPTSAVLKVFDAMHDLEQPLLDDPQHDLIGYIGLISRLEEAISFLSQNCPMAIEWLQDFVDFLEHNQVLQDAPMNRISSNLKLLQAWQSSGDQAKLDGGLHSASLDRLEAEFQRILSEESLLAFSLTSQAARKADAVSNRKLTAQTLKSLHLIVQKLALNGRRQRCMDLYVETRVKVIRDSFKALPLNYLQIKSGTKIDWKSVGMYIGPWTQHMELVAKSLCEPEYQLCNQVLERLGYEDWEESFGKIVLAGGILELLQFGEVVVKSRDEPQKLFKLLDMFEAMNNLRSCFGKLFGGPGCKEVQQRTRELLKLIVQGAHDIFLEFKQQIENQRGIQAPSDGSLPKVSSFVLGYVKHLVGDFYGPIITQVLTICHSWKEDAMEKKSTDSLLPKAVLSIMNTLVLNIHEWANSFKEEPVFHRLFLCNNFWYLAVNCRASELKAFVGESWLKEQQQQAEHNISLYMKEGWAKIVQHLNLPEVMTLTGSRAAARDLLKTKLKAFNAAFEELYQKHAKWIVIDAELREKMGVKVVKSVVPAYRTYLQSYGPLLEQDGSKSKYVKYSPQSLERILGSLFQGRSEKILSGSDKKMSGSAAIAHPTTVSVV